MMIWYPPLNVSSGLTCHMFMHVVETNQHSLHDIYVHGRLYPTHAWVRDISLFGWSLLNIFASLHFALSMITTCASKILKPSFAI